MTTTATSRQTWRKQAILKALALAPGPLSAADVHLAAEDQAGGRRMNLSTVYRTLTALAAAGTVAITPTGYLLAHRPAPLVCRVCGETIPLPLLLVERLTATIKDETSYAIPPAAVRLTGVCRSCQETPASC